MASRPSRSTREFGRSTALLTAAIAASGIFIYLFFVLASHALDREDYGKVVVLWSAMFVGLSILCRPVEFLLSRSVASLRARGESTTHAIRVAAQIQTAVMVGFLAFALIFRDQIERELFDGDELFFWSLVLSVVGLSISFFARGVLAGQGRFATFSAIVLTDAVTRTVFALTVTIGLVEGPAPMALSIALAPAISALAWPLANAIVERRGHRTPDEATPLEAADPNFTLVEGGGFATGIVFVMISEQILLNGGPLLVRAEVGVAAAGFIFNVLLIARAPVVLFQAAASTLLPHLTRIQDSDYDQSEDDFRHSVLVTLGAIGAFGAATLLVVLAIGPAVMEIAFGNKFDYPRSDLLIVAAGMPFYLGATTLTQAALARGNVRLVVFSWVATALALVAWYMLSPLEAYRTVEVGFTASSVLLFALVAATYRTYTPRSSWVR